MTVMVWFGVASGVAVAAALLLAGVGRLGGRTDPYRQVEEFERFRAALREEAVEPPPRRRGPLTRGTE